LIERCGEDAALPETSIDLAFSPCQQPVSGASGVSKLSLNALWLFLPLGNGNATEDFAT
jgi:hypothetical protein